MSVEAPRLDDQLCFALYAASRAVSRAYAPMLDALGLTYPQFLVMMALWELDGVTVSDLGSRLTLDSGTLTPLLKRLEKSTLVSRRRDPADQRRVRIVLTRRGRALGPRAASAQHRLVCQLGADARSLAALRDTLHQLTRRLIEADEAD